MEDTQTTSTAVDVEQIQAAMNQLQEQLNLLLQGKRMARGTSDLTRQAKEAAAMVAEPPPEYPLETKIENLIKKESLSVRQISKTLATSQMEVDKALLTLRRGRKVWNVGSTEFPLWTFRIGDRTSLPELVTLVRRLISERPMSTAELSKATGARVTRVDGAIITLRRAEPQIFNLGSARSAKWFLLSEKAAPARLEDKG